MKKKLFLATILFISLLCCVLVGSACTNGNDKDNDNAIKDSDNKVEIISVEGATFNDDAIFMFVNKDVDEVNLSNKVVCSEGCYWKLYSDNTGQTEIVTKIASGNNGKLKDGENIFYIVVSSENVVKTNTYKLIIQKSYQVTVSFFDNDEIVKIENAYTGEEFSVDFLPKFKGYKFNCWQTEEGERVEKITLWQSINLFADKTPIQFSAELDVNGGNNLEKTSFNLTYGSSYELPVPTKEGSTFIGWYVDNIALTDSNGKTLSEWRIDVAETITAKWQVKRYNVVLKTDANYDVDMSGAGTYEFNSTVTVTAVTQNGYTFIGWYNSDNELISEETKYIFNVKKDIELNAKWTYYTLSTTKNINEAGTITSYREQKVTVGKEITLNASTSTYAGYTWLGWYNGEELLTKETTYKFEMPSKNLEYTAKWTYYTLSTTKNIAEAGNATSYSEQKVTVGKEVTLNASTSTYAGYTWLGWYNGEELLTKETTYKFEMPSKNLEYTAKWTYYTLNTTKNIDEAGTINSYKNKKVTVGTEIVLTASSNLGYAWHGWYKGESLLTTERIYSFTMPAENIKITALWIIDDPNLSIINTAVMGKNTANIWNISNAVDGGVLFKFIPETTGVYYLYSKGVLGDDPAIIVYNSSRDTIASFDNLISYDMFLRDNREDFEGYVVLTAGETYYLRVSKGLQATGEIDFYIEYKGESLDVLRVATTGDGMWTFNPNLGLDFEYYIAVNTVYNEMDGYYHAIDRNGKEGSVIYIDFIHPNFYDQNNHSLLWIIENGYFDFSKNYGPDYTSIMMQYYYKSIEGKDKNDELYGMLEADEELVNYLCLFMDLTSNESNSFKSGFWLSLACYYKHYGV